jgi:two-component system C4-dicarboxylate transport sensor histidine kinase DctB
MTITKASRSSLKSLVAIFIMVILASLIWLSYKLSWNRGIQQLHENNRQQLDQFIDHLDTRLARFEFIPQLIAKNQLLVDVLNNPDSGPRIDIANHFLQEINAIIGASDTYLMSDQGLTLAASNWQNERPFVGENFSFRPYFNLAMQGKTGRYFALGNTSRKRGYYFSYPVTYAAQHLGVIVVKMDLSNIEEHWSGRNTQFIVSDTDGIIFITTQPDWLFNSIKNLSDETRQLINLTQRYLDIEIENLDYSTTPTATAGSQIMEIKPKGARAYREYLSLKQDTPEAGWSVMILAPLKETRRNSMTAALLVLLVFTLVGLTAYLGWQRHKRRQDRERFHLDAKKELEQEVSVRTADLRHEVEEHKRTEQVLMDTQGELIQTAKLAVLGQMSASISHELNNPLAAIRSYADNARQFLSRDNNQRVDENLERIARLTEHMGKISSQLKIFARKSEGHLKTIKVQPVIQSAIDLIGPQYKHSRININTLQVQPGLEARADVIQLEQVLVNLINNAMNAMEGKQKGEIKICAYSQEQQIFIDVEDMGAGIDEENMNRIFEPFFTTRKSGLGLGLSISARIMDSMHGALSAKNLPHGGARFTITLKAT